MVVHLWYAKILCLHLKVINTKATVKLIGVHQLEL